MRDHDILCCETDFWVFIIICVVLVAFAGIASGLALGLLSFSQVDLEVLIKSGQPQDQKDAAKVLRLVKNEHLLLCTLLIGKSLAMEALPIFLESLLPFWAAILVSVTLVLAFAEVIPQAVCSRYGLHLGAKMTHLVRLLIVVFLPLSYPFSKKHSVLLRRAELKTLVDLHANEAGKGGELSHHETMIIGGALDLTFKTAKDAMTPISQTFSLDINSKLDKNTLGLIASKGHSRIPIYSGTPTNIIGVILLKNLVFIRPEDEKPIKYLTIRKIPRVYDNWPLYDILHQFKKGHSHMVAVVKSNKDINSKSNSKLAGSGGLIFPHEQERLSTSEDMSSPLCSSETAYCIPASKHVVEEAQELETQNTRYRQGLRTQNVLSEIIESVQSCMDEEVIGIITMEDVMEELLQEDILDETDEYIDVHKKIKINLLPFSRRSSPSKSPRKPAPLIYWRTPQQSPLSSYSTPAAGSPSCHIQEDHQPQNLQENLHLRCTGELQSRLHCLHTALHSTPATGSPIHPYNQQPIISPALHTSAGPVRS
ncbi:hypothetical protein C1H46_039132 [Malus baccata]|uniref:CNNM transmembrane domain-containing protein n=1 Tax=Malus baccata TaxID=106549 RepID=A0A540KM92_MALBA|nr:hypothetical protein C1H46_039132 [Malus baccata]